MRIVAIIQARMGSTRLPGKVMLDLAGEPMLIRVVNRVRRAVTVDEVVVATSSDPANDRIASLCQDHKVSCFRGSEDDVLDRYHRAALEFNAEAVVRVTSDCPLVDPGIIDRIVREFIKAHPGVDYISNVMPRTFPRGLDVEVFSVEALVEAELSERDPRLREHVTMPIYCHPDKFVCVNIKNDADLSGMRWTVDTIEDYELVRRIYDYFGNDAFDCKQVVTLLSDNPEWLELNRHIQQKAI